ncbi:MAG: O-acetylhomoserine sulfhydrylase [Candidatus Firestonebacteria bacterium RIFOXYC2_FULL_39_67]|nr:MAG: O-acetylhomoserine sulfhydrylase [Candidatus Firestonebacteria bacterium RIFOXYD2_FULL_39_29]OGF56649.1 MAG: O-acetylhomoserine sulfhydrylase [Candidatus Firestonebacteria bacterium RIFOXYC2_FULL_39_67]OGF57125.1 MAG: O-acetylhomoserine sulfhydrylase [Candidatus Firestonebacteria bacterium RifOxyC12_full_39_7]
MQGFSTKALHSPFVKKDVHGSLHMPVYDSVSFEFDSAEEQEEAFLGKKQRHVYTRITNPTVEHLEQKVKYTTGAFSVLAVASGMAAISNTILAAAGRGDNIITTKLIFGNTYSLFERTLKSWGLEVRYADFSDPSSVENLIDGNTRAIFFETITNPQLEVVNIKELSAIAVKSGILMIADTTVTPLDFFDSKAFGVDVEVLSATKYISGGATTIGGLIIDNGTFDWAKNPKLKENAKFYGQFAFIAKLRKEVFRNIGACLAPHNAYLQSLGIETLALRAERSCQNTLKVAEYLSGRKGVRRVNYPGLTSSKYYPASLSQFGKKSGAILTFEMSTKVECFKLLNKLKMIRRATNINDNKTLAIHPSSTIFCEYKEDLKREMRVYDNMIRLSVGIEDVEDIINDIEQALEV